MRHLVGLLIAVTLHVAPSASDACSTFCFESGEGAVFGKNYDWHIGDGLVVVNKRGVAKVAMTEEKAAQWTSRFGSVSFNQYGCEMPSGGMNEAGLIIELMWLDDTEYPAPDDRPTMGSLQWIQYQLDTSASIDDVVASDRDVRISRGTRGKIHFLVSDRSGEVASVEFIHGEMVVNRGAKMPAKVLTNSTYARSANALGQYDGFGGDRPLPASKGSIDRFVTAAGMVNDYDGSNAVDYAFDVLQTVAQGNSTQWSIVYDVAGARIYFRTLESGRKRYIDVAALDFSCAQPMQVLDIDVDMAGNVTGRLTDYTESMNYDLMRRAFSGTPFLAHVPDDAIRGFAGYPAQMRCAQ